MKTPAFDLVLCHTVDRDTTPAMFGLTVKLIDTFTEKAPNTVSESEEFADMGHAMVWIQTAITEFVERTGLIPEKT